MIYLILLTWIATSTGNPIKSTTPFIYYTPASSQYLGNNFYPFLQYPAISPAIGKALQSIQTPNELIFYPHVPAQPLIFNQHQTSNIHASRFTAPPDGLVDAIYNWFAENNVELPPEKKKNEALPEKGDGSKDQEKIENPDKPRIAGEAEVLAEADKNPNLNYPKKSLTPEFKPGQRFYILNGQPQFVNDYQPILPRVSPIIPQLVTQNTIPDTRNILILQPQQEPEIKPNLKLRKDTSTPVAQAQETSGKNVVLLRKNIQEELPGSNIQQEQIKPVRYHSQNLKAQNYLFVPEPQQSNNQQQIKERLIGIRDQTFLQGYPQQQLLLGRYLPQVNDIKSQALLQQAQIAQTPIHQTHYVPVEVVPPQAPLQSGQIQYPFQSQDQFSPQQLSFIHIPVDKNIQPPQYIKTLVPIQISAKTQIPEMPIIPIQSQPQRSSPKQVLYFSPSVPQPSKTDLKNDADGRIVNQQQIQNEQVNRNVPPGIAALEFARYIASRHGDIYGDSVVIDAKSDDNDKEDETTDEIQADSPQEQAIAQAQPAGVAIAGKGGVAATAPHGTAFAGDNGLAVASPQATAVGGPNSENPDKKPKRT